MQTLEIGTRIFNHGDMANFEHFGTVTNVKTSRWGTDYEITPDADAEDRDAPYWISAAIVSDHYDGHAGTRIVTEAAHNEWRDARMARLRERLART